MRYVKELIIWVLFFFIFIVYKNTTNFISTWAVCAGFIFAITPMTMKYLLKNTIEYKKNAIINYFTYLCLCCFIPVSLHAIIRIIGVPLKIENCIIIPTDIIALILLVIGFIKLVNTLSNANYRDN